MSLSLQLHGKGVYLVLFAEYVVVFALGVYFMRVSKERGHLCTLRKPLFVANTFSFFHSCHVVLFLIETTSAARLQSCRGDRSRRAPTCSKLNTVQRCADKSTQAPVLYSRYTTQIVPFLYGGKLVFNHSCAGSSYTRCVLKPVGRTARSGPTSTRVLEVSVSVAHSSTMWHIQYRRR